jgi:hypothetical protein
MEVRPELGLEPTVRLGPKAAVAELVVLVDIFGFTIQTRLPFHFLLALARAARVEQPMEPGLQGLSPPLLELVEVQAMAAPKDTRLFNEAVFLLEIKQI